MRRLGKPVDLRRERSQVWGNAVILEKCPEPDAATGPNSGSRNATRIRLRSVGINNISGKAHFRKCAARPCTNLRCSY